MVEENGRKLIAKKRSLDADVHNCYLLSTGRFGGRNAGGGKAFTVERDAGQVGPVGQPVVAPLYVTVYA